MNIEQIFSKQLTRNINGVVKAEQVDNESVYIELDEYVVTNELDRHFRAFFEAYTPAVTNRNSELSGKIGVWVSGFFGSGKSHFIKILSYLLENREVEKDGQHKKAYDFFKEKITDPLLLADISKAVNQETDVILFNIDSRANTDDRENAILKVFLKVFNERVGYCADFPHIAHLERELDKRKQYTAFKNKFAELTDSTWEKERDAYDFYRDELSAALSVASAQSIDSARQSVEQLENNFPLDIHNFCKWVNDYLDASGDKNLLFLVDEVGQFIGKSSAMMLKLQTITEDLGTFCKGRAWVIVTSQADIDAAIGSIGKSEGDEFSKIQGRFVTRLQLSSSNTSEVIQKRLLEKTEPAREQLLNVFSSKGDILRNQLSFDATTTASLKSYDDAPSFVDNYPFIPYHYTLVQNVFESIRAKGATGKHLAMGERSLLDAFQSAAKQIKDKSLDVLIPFFSFYAPIEGFLEPAVKRTIDQACDLESLTDFDGEILKTLFLIRYVDTVKSTLDNLVTLSINHIDTDKIQLKNQIEDSLTRLERELLIARNGDEYVFLTNEEKEIENEIRHTDVETSEISNKLSDIIFDDVLRRQKSYRYPINKQDFQISRFCNGHPKDGSNLEDLVVKLISPLDSHYENFLVEQHCLSHSLEGDGSIVIKLGERKRLWDDLVVFIKTDRFLKQNGGKRPEHEHLLREKQMENTERGKNLVIEFETLFVEAELYAIGKKINTKLSSASTILEDACKYVIENTFSKLNLLRATTGEVLREIQAVLQADDLGQLGLDLNADDCNPDATREVAEFITLKIDRNEAVYLRDVLSRFTRRPFGWAENEVLLLVARLGLASKISFTLKNNELSLKDAYDPFTTVRQRGEIRIQKIRQHDNVKITKAIKLAKELFAKSFTGSEEKELHEFLNGELNLWFGALKSFDTKAQTGHYPGKKQIEAGKALVSSILSQASSFLMIERFIEENNALQDFAEDFEDLDDFYNSQFQTWQTLVSFLKGSFSVNRSALEKMSEAQKALAQLDSIYAMEEPYAHLRHINSLIEQVKSINEQLVTDKRSHALERVNQRIDAVNNALQEASATDELKNKALYSLQQCKVSINNTSSITQIFSEQAEASDFEDDAYLLINQFIEDQRKVAIKPVAPKPSVSDDNETIIVPQNTPAPKRTVSVNPSSLITNPTIETPQQVESYISQLRDELLKIINDGDKVRIK